MNPSYSTTTIYKGATGIISSSISLATDTQWRMGLFLQGLWVTLKASIFAMMLGCLIGVCGGVASHPVLPPLRWIIVVSTEIIRRIPLWNAFTHSLVIKISLNL